MGTTRRQILRNLSLTTGGLAFAPFLGKLQAEATGDARKLPKRFVFVTRSNGLRTYGIAPKGLEDLVMQPGGTRPKPNDKLIEHDLNKHELNESMSALAPFKKQISIINGLSAHMVSGGGHGAGFGSLGAYNGKSIAVAETVDGALANALPGIFKHLGFKVDHKLDAKIDRPNVTAFGAKKPGSFYCDPSLAYAELFGSIATNKDVKAKQLGEKKLLDFLIEDTKRVKTKLNAVEKEKLDHYLGAFESLSDRRVKLAGMKDVLDKTAPQFSDKYTSEVEVHRLEAHFDMAAAALIAGLTNVVTIRTDELELHYRGLGITEWSVHTVGHVEGNPKKWDEQRTKQAITGVEARRRIRQTHFDQVGNLARKLAAVPEGDGTMLDNTLIVVLSDHGAQHHPNFSEFPFVLIGNIGGALRTGRYLHYPSSKYADHRTIGSFYTALMHAAGVPRDGFGQFDPKLPEATQKTPLSELLA